MPISRSIKNSCVAITTGDVHGVGFEVTAKALHALGPQPHVSFFVFRHQDQERKQKKFFTLIDQKFVRLTFSKIEDALGFYSLLKAAKALDQNFIFDLALQTAPVDWVIAATKLCDKKILSSLVTGPLSKTGIKAAGYSFVGHTGVFRWFYPKKSFFMGFVGQSFNVLLATDHIPLRLVENTLQKKRYLQSVLTASQDFSTLFKATKKIALLGLNPHAGEKGILGSFEKNYLTAAVKKNLRLYSGRLFDGPLSPDAAFLKQNWKKYQFFLCLYHDQGLIPFKMQHGQDSGVHITVGLPFLRTSVDHGTAFDLYNKNKANPSSMLEAIQINLKILRGKKI